MLAALDGAAAHMRGKNNVSLRKETGMNLRFVFGDIHPGAAEVTAGQRGGEGEFQLML